MTDPMHELRRNNLKKQLEKSKLSKSDFAKRLGTSRSYLSQVLSDGFRFGEKAARGFETTLRLAPGTLDLVEEPGLMSVESWERPEDLPEGVYAIVPRVAVSLSAGAGAYLGEEMDLPPLAFRQDWIAKKNVTSRSNLRVCQVTGDSMEGYLLDGDTVLIDVGQTDVVDNEVYALRYGDDVRIKRLSKRFDGGLLIRSDNQRYSDEALSSAEAQQIAIIGRMLWRGG